MLSDAEGAQLVRLARSAVEKYLSESAVLEPAEQDSHTAGVFVTLNYVTRFKEEHLRGCIGFPMPGLLQQSVIQAAIAAATQDPRFPPVDMAELGSTIFEVSVLTVPEELKCSPADYASRIAIGRDGLMLRWKNGSGLLLPQVPLELKWDVNEYLANICYKAGAPLEALHDSSSRLYTFQALVFKELEPLGKVTRL